MRGFKKEHTSTGSVQASKNGCNGKDTDLIPFSVPD